MFTCFLHVRPGCHMIAIMSHRFFTYLAKLPHRRRLFAADEMVVGMHDETETLYRVQRGMVNLVRFQEDGGTVVLQRAGPGAIMAEASVFTPAYHCAAIAEQESEVLAYPMKAVRALLADNPEAALAYARVLAREVRESRKRAEILALRKVSERLAAWLVWNDGQLPARGQWHRVAEEIGVSREALYRALAKPR